MVFDLLFGDKRPGRLKKAAAELMAEFYAEARPLSEFGFDGRFLLFSQDGERTYINLIQGADGGEYLLFDYEWVGHGDHTSLQTVAAFMLAGSPPVFIMRPESFWERWGVGEAKYDVDFPENEAFSRSYLLRGVSEADVRAFFKPHMLEHFAKNPGWSIECGRDWMIAYRDRKIVEPDGMKIFLDEALKIREVFCGLKRTDFGKLQL